MTTMLMSASSFHGTWVGRPALMEDGGCSEIVKAFGNNIFSIAKHITQNDEDAAEVLIETFLVVCPDLEGCRDDEKVRLRLMMVAVREAFSKLGIRKGDDSPCPDSAEDLVIREFSIWGDNYQHDSFGPGSSVLEQGLRSLDTMCRTVFVLRDIEEFSVEQIAKIVGRSVPAVEVCLLRARLQLRETLAPQMKLQ